MTRTRMLGRGQILRAWSALAAACVAVSAQSPPATPLPTLLPDMLAPLPVPHEHKHSPVPQGPATLPVPQGPSTGPPTDPSSAGGSNSALVFVLVVVGELLDSFLGTVHRCVFTVFSVRAGHTAVLACSV